MKQITDQDIKQAADDTACVFGIEHDYFSKGAKWMQEQVKPEWISCTHKDVLPRGRYALYVYQPSTKIGSEVMINITKDKEEISYLFVTHYCPIQLPEPPKQ